MTSSGPWSRFHLPSVLRAAGSPIPARARSVTPLSNITFAGSTGAADSGAAAPEALASEPSADEDEDEDEEEDEGGALKPPLSSEPRGVSCLRGRPPLAP